MKLLEIQRLGLYFFKCSTNVAFFYYVALLAFSSVPANDISHIPVSHEDCVEVHNQTLSIGAVTTNSVSLAVKP